MARLGALVALFVVALFVFVYILVYWWVEGAR